MDIIAAIGGLKTAYDIAKGLNATATAVQINDVKLTLQEHIMAAREALSVAQEAEAASARRIADLEKEIMRLKDWSTEKERYELVNVWQGAFAYMPKPGMRGSEPAHWLCTNCFDHGRKSFMQNKGGVDGAQFGCDACKASFRVASRVQPFYPEADA
jgi:hypothetical protein